MTASLAAACTPSGRVYHVVQSAAGGGKGDVTGEELTTRKGRSGRDRAQALVELPDDRAADLLHSKEAAAGNTQYHKIDGTRKVAE